MNRTRAAVDRMAAQAVPTAEQIRRADPAPEHELARILAQPRLGIVPAPDVRNRSWRPVVVVCAVLAVLGALVVLVPALHGEQAPTAVAPDAPATTPAPPPRGAPLSFDPTGVEADPAVLLRQLADRAAAQPAPPRTGDISYLHIRAGGRNMAPTPSYYSYDNEFWTAPDGSWERVGTLQDGTREPTDHHGPEEGTPRTALPTDPVELEQHLLAVDKGIFTGQVPSAGDWFAARSPGREEFLDPAVQAAFLRLLASKDGITVAGAVTDRVGRRGVGVTATWHRPPEIDGYPTYGPETEYLTLIFDPGTGALLHTEDTTPGASPQDPPELYYYESYLESGWVRAFGDRP
jgi:hypothetical protein